LYNNETPLLVDLADLLYQLGIALSSVFPTKDEHNFEYNSLIFIKLVLKGNF